MEDTKELDMTNDEIMRELMRYRRKEKPPEYLSVTEIVKIVNLSESSVRKAIKEYGLDCIEFRGSDGGKIKAYLNKDVLNMIRDKMENMQ